MSLGRGFAVSFSPDGTKVALNPTDGSGRPDRVRVIDLATMASEEFASIGGLASFVDNDYLYLPGGGEVRVLDIRTGEVTRLNDADDPLLRAKLKQRGSGSGALTVDGRYRLLRRTDRADDFCRDVPAAERQRCSAEAFEQWTIEEVSTGRIVRELRAHHVGSAGPGEVVVATSPQCQGADGSLEWCEDVLQELRADDAPGTFPVEYVTGTSNVFIVDVATGDTGFIATAVYTANTGVSPSNWPLMANDDYIAWTDAYCGQDRGGHTFLFDRATGELAELDTGFWVTFTPGGDLGVGAFGPQAILDLPALSWRIVLPQGTVDVVQSPDGQYLAVGGVLGHGGLCG
ncbi:MAG: hypothetical protein WEC75_06885 [Dehalococcoidia bacterium]